MLDAACRGEGLSTAYQPIVDTRHATVAGYEALTRFSGFSEHNPEVWFRTARALGRSAELESVALRTALKARPQLPRNCFLTLNISPDTLSSGPVRDVWDGEKGLGGLVIELTEQTPIESYEGLRPDLDRLRASGASIAVDDAGAGYAGLRHLLTLRPAMIKIDRDLVRGVDRDEARRALIGMLGAFADRIDAWILAEGVERAEELDALVSLGVPLAQGYHLGRPAPPWAPMAPGVAGQLARKRRSQFPSPRELTVRDVAEPSVTIADPATVGETFAADPSLQSVVLLDANQRPVAVLRPDTALNGLAIAGMRINLDTPLKEALTRSMTRSPTARFDPLLITDSAGRFAGLARMERMITALTGAEHLSGYQPDGRPTDTYTAHTGDPHPR
ncbi:EAL domain-containing protein [Pseudarthrobacter sp. NPDC080039]|uniref:EAL domain-containing protein n=1 Tax=unclassified Pseudarthrobacter TaxID=2647000 RepID=UPI00344F3F80